MKIYGFWTIIEQLGLLIRLMNYRNVSFSYREVMVTSESSEDMNIDNL